MLLSRADVKRLERAGYEAHKFVGQDKQGYTKLRNRHGFCVFYDAERHRCRIYRFRPLGCRVYPVIFSEEEGVVVDDICPVRETVSRVELERKGKIVVRLLRRIDREAENSCL